MALDDGENLQVREIAREAVDKAIQQRIPGLIRLEALCKPVVAALVIVIAIPGALYGTKQYAESEVRAAIGELNKSDPNGPMAKLQHFSQGLRATFEGQVDSATFKMLRYGCNASKDNAAPKFPSCDFGTGAATGQAKAALDEEDQTVAFAARTSQQTVKLVLALRPVDTAQVLDRVALQISWTPPDVNARGKVPRGSKVVTLSTANVNKAGYVATSAKGGQVLRLYGTANDGLTDEPLNVEIDLTESLKGIDSGLHQLRIKAVTDPDSKDFNGAERFFLRALVSVNHRVVAP